MNHNFIKDTVFKTVKFNYDGEINFYDYDGVKVSYDGKCAEIGAFSKASFARGCFLLAMNISEGKKEFEIEQKPHFKDCGLMLDCSRNAVMKVEYVKKYINCIASLGMNFLMLYTEDTFEIDNRPRFGYLRGRYTHAEIREMVAYGEEMGVELIPCIQTLGHMMAYLKWGRSGAPDYTGEKILQMRENDNVLLCGADATYKFIEDAIRTCREDYKTKRIHLGMDEAFGVGRGKYLNLHGYKNPYDIIREHLDVVLDICKKYDFEPMIWSDMFFRLGTGGAYYKYDFEFPEGTSEKVPEGIELVYWDYYHNKPEVYDKMLQKHQELTDKIVFAGGIVTWYGFLVTHDYSYMNSIAAAKACVKNKIDTVMATMWGDDGNETNAFFALSLLPIYSEYCYIGEDCTEDDIKRASEFLTKINFFDAEAMGQLAFVKENEYLKAWHDLKMGESDLLIGKRLFYGDIMYDLSITKESCDIAIETYEKCAKRMAELANEESINKENYRYAYLLYKICSMKAELVKNLRSSYQSGDKGYLKKIKNEFLPQLKEWYDEFAKNHKKQWMEVYKPFGFEVLSFRYGGVIRRIDDVAETLDKYLNNEIDSIPELAEKVLICEESSQVGISSLISPSGRV